MKRCVKNWSFHDKNRYHIYIKNSPMNLNFPREWCLEDSHRSWLDAPQKEPWERDPTFIMLTKETGQGGKVTSRLFSDNETFLGLNVQWPISISCVELNHSFQTIPILFFTSYLYMARSTVWSTHPQLNIGSWVI